MPNAQLMAKYGISLKTLQEFYRKLEKAKLRCPSCGETRWEKFDECPRCGVIVEKFGTDPIVYISTKAGTVPITVTGETTDFFKGRTRLVGAIIGSAILVLMIAGIWWIRSTAEEMQTDMYFNPVKQQAAKISKRLVHGLTFLEHRQMHTRLLDDISQLQVKLKGRHPEIVRSLDMAAMSLSRAEEAWKKQIEAETSVQREGATTKMPAIAGLAQSAMERKARGEKLSKLDRALIEWQESVDNRESAWRDFSTSTETAIALMNKSH
jgi:hypothetical protein